MTDTMETAIGTAMALALRRRSEVKRKQAAEGTATVEDHPDVVIRSPEAALASRMADEYEAIAQEIENHG